jgi:hypothetical protein
MGRRPPRRLPPALPVPGEGVLDFGLGEQPCEDQIGYFFQGGQLPEENLDEWIHFGALGPPNQRTIWDRPATGQFGIPCGYCPAVLSDHHAKRHHVSFYHCIEDMLK